MYRYDPNFLFPFVHGRLQFAFESFVENGCEKSAEFGRSDEKARW
jgi:hypothetical protein